MELTINDRQVQITLRSILKRIGRALFMRKTFERTDDGQFVEKHKLHLFKVWLLVGFSLFITEEACQQLIFSCFPLQEVGAYETLAKRSDQLKFTAGVGRVMNYALAWGVPPMLIAYELFWRSTFAYADSLDVMLAVVGEENRTTVDVAAIARSNDSPGVETVGGDRIANAAQIDFGNLTDIIVGPPEFNPAPLVDGGILLDRAESMYEIQRYVDWPKTITFPCTQCSIGEAGSTGRPSVCESPFGFALVWWNDALDYLADKLGGQWVTVRGKIEYYADGMQFQVIPRDSDTILDYTPLLP